MSSKHTLFRLFYFFGYKPWDGHPLAQSLRNLIEGNGSPPLPAGKVLELGCGTGDNAIYLDDHGWQVTAVDFVAKAIELARAKAGAQHATVRFEQADVTRLSSEGLGDDFGLITDNGCLHAMSDTDRDSYVREVSAVAAPDARLLIIALEPGVRRNVRGIDQADIERRFATGWTLLATGYEPALDRAEQNPGRYYLFQRNA
jgi:SAM-dependent methyltransferase